MNIQTELNKQNEQFKPKKSPRTVYVQPKRINGKDTYQQPRKQGDS